MLLQRKFKTLTTSFIIASLLLVQACGLSPIHSVDGNNNAYVTNEFKSVKISPITFGRHGQILQTRLENLLNPKADATDKKYNLQIELSSNDSPLAIEQDAEITRYNMILTARIKLTDSTSGNVIFENLSKITGSYKTSTSDFATYTVKEDTLTRIVKEAAEDIRMRLSSYFLSKQ